MADNKISFINFSTSLNLLKKVEPKSKNDEQNLGLELKNADSVNELKFVDEEYPIILPESDKYTTNAMGEEGGDKILPDLGEQPKYTTCAMGEEGGGYNPPPEIKLPYVEKEPEYTTFATGEEGGDSSPPEIKPYIEKEPEYTTLAMGEEGG
ncbi:hypothetical protein J6Q66_06705, partial [bacterium]|nr:hypothetical protein [bacterium]